MIIAAAIAAGIVGLFVGGLLNVLADDLPDYDIPKRPHYPDGSPRPLVAWLGVTAFLMGKRCPDASPDKNNCLSWRYPITEIATVIGFIVTVWRADVIANGGTAVFEQNMNTTQVIFWLYYMAMFILVVVIDIEHRLILFAVIIPSTAVALLDLLLTPMPSADLVIQWWMAPADPTLIRGLRGAGLGFGIFFAFYAGGFVYQKAVQILRGWDLNEIPFGYGDVMLAGLCGLILGWRPLILAMFLTVFLGAVGALVYIIAQKLQSKGGGMTTAIPYGPYIVAGAILMLLFDSWIQNYVLAYIYG
jgi:prepilin signal peptidase PulO-like enzyme (type II secretory pathway)